MMRKLVFLLVFINIIMLFSASPLAAQPVITGQSAVLIDMTSGQVLYDLDKDKQLYPASTTKILTAIIAIESGHLDDVVTVSGNPPRLDGTRVYLEEGEKVTLRELVEAMMIHSANDAALAIAEHLGGSKEGFAEIMNAKAKEIGAVNSHFSNPHGLTEKDHYTTAYDLALIARYAMQNETFRKIAASKVLDWEGQAWQTRLINKNQLLWDYEGANGVKKGYTPEAKSTLVASAERDGRSYIAVVLYSSETQVWKDAAKLLDYGFSNFQQITLAKPDEVVATLELDESDKLQVVPRQEFSISLPVEEKKNVETKLFLQPLPEKIEVGQVVGQQVFTVDGEEAGRVELLAANEAAAPTSGLPYILFAAFWYSESLAKYGRLSDAGEED